MTTAITLNDDERRGLAWRKASLSTNNGACVEVAAGRQKIVLRDSKDPEGPVLVFTHAEWAAFLDGAKGGEFENLLG